MLCLISSSPKPFCIPAQSPLLCFPSLSGRVFVWVSRLLPHRTLWAPEKLWQLSLPLPSTIQLNIFLVLANFLQAMTVTFEFPVWIQIELMISSFVQIEMW